MKYIKISNTLIVLLIITGIVMDVGVNLTNIHIIYVDENYVYYIYSAIFTIAILSYSIISLITGALDKRYYGYRIKDILISVNKELNIKKYIIFSLIFIVISTLLVFLCREVNVINTITMLLISLLFYEAKISIKIFDILTDDKVCYEIINDYYKNEIKKECQNRNVFINNLDCLCLGLDDALKSGNYYIVKDIIKFIYVLIQSNRELSDMVYEKINERVSEVVKKWNYESIINDFIPITDNDLENLKEILVIPLYDIEFLDDKEILKGKYLDVILRIDTMEKYKNDIITDGTVTYLLRHYFEHLLNNNAISNKTKNQLVHIFFNRCCRLSNWNGYEKEFEYGMNPVETALLYIIRDYVLNENDIYDRQIVMKYFIIEMMNNAYYKDNGYFVFLSYICEAFYFYSYREKEMLTQNAREAVRDLFNYSPKTQDIERVMMSYYIRDGIDDILFAMGQRINCKIDKTRLFEYFPNYLAVKSVVWTEEADIEFAFLLYVIFWDECLFYDFWNVCFRENEINDSVKELIATTLINLFDYTTRHFCSEYISELEQAQEFFDTSKDIMPEKIQERLFEEFNNIIKGMNISQVIEEELDINVKEEQRKLDEYLSKKDILFIDQTAKLESYIKFYGNPIIYYKTSSSFTAQRIYNMLIKAVRECIIKFSDVLNVSFDDNGIEKMKSYLKTADFDLCNYLFTDDWAFSKYSDEENYKELKALTDKLEYKKTYNIRVPFYCKKDRVKMRIKITSVNKDDLEINDCEEYIGDYRTSNGMYNIKGALYTREEAITFIKNSCYKESISFKLCYDFNKDDITRISFDRNSLFKG